MVAFVLVVTHGCEVFQNLHRAHFLKRPIGRRCSLFLITCSVKRLVFLMLRFMWWVRLHVVHLLMHTLMRYRHIATHIIALRLLVWIFNIGLKWSSSPWHFTARRTNQRLLLLALQKLLRRLLVDFSISLIKLLLTIMWQLGDLMSWLIHLRDYWATSD